MIEVHGTATVLPLATVWVDEAEVAPAVAAVVAAEVAALVAAVVAAEVATAPTVG